MVLDKLKGKLVVSCQAAEGDAFRDPASVARFAIAAVAGGAAGIRACGAEDVRAIRAAVSVPVIGIAKVMQADGRVLITPSFDEARELVSAGADAIALDCTARGQRYGALERLRRIREELRVPVLADIATVEEGMAAANAGAHAILTTMRGYTDETRHVGIFEAGFVAALCRVIRVRVIAEGRIDTPDAAREAIEAGAYCVIVGGAITRPAELSKRFAAAVASAAPGQVAAIDLGGTNTKSGIVSPAGEILQGRTVPTPSGGRAALLEHLRIVAEGCLAGAPAAALGIATAGWVDPSSGRVVYATENLPGWTGTEIAQTLSGALGVPVAVENDANALALAEQTFGAGHGVDHFVCITLGTGVGGGCCVGGRLNRGAHFFANALGHIAVEPDGAPCTCGRSGCLEQYANAAALRRYAGERFESAEQIIAAANEGDLRARAAVRTVAKYLGRGCATMLHILDSELIVLSGGIAQKNLLLVEALREELGAHTMMWDKRRVRVELSPLGYYGGVLGAAAIARDMLAGRTGGKGYGKAHTI